MTKANELHLSRNELRKNEVDNIWVSNAATWKTKAVSCIAANKHFMTTVDILICVLGAEQFKKVDDDFKKRKEMVTLLSVTLSNLVKEGYIRKAKLRGFKGNYYGLKNWFQEDGRMRGEYADATLYYLINEESHRIDCCS